MDKKFDLIIKDLKVEVDGVSVLKGLDLVVPAGKISVIMGPNGSGKSTLCYALMGHPDYTVKGGTVDFNGASLLSMSTEDRARGGLFLGFQNPVEVEGLNFGSFLRTAVNAGVDGDTNKKKPMEFRAELEAEMKVMKIDPDWSERGLNKGFSGGERKRSEILQMMMLKPRIAILDEIDSGLDIDALRLVAESVARARSEFGTGVLLITHYQRLLNYVEPDFVHVMSDGRIVASGGPELAHKLEAEGYKNILPKSDFPASPNP